MKNGKYFLFSLFICSTALLSNASVKESIYCKKDSVEVLDPMPTFPGGESELMKFIRTNLKYPIFCGDTEGRVILRFQVCEDGSISDIKVLRSLDPIFDKEAIRIVELMPKWTPGKDNKTGKTVPVYYTLPILFKHSN